MACHGWAIRHALAAGLKHGFSLLEFRRHLGSHLSKLVDGDAKRVEKVLRVFLATRCQFESVAFLTAENVGTAEDHADVP